MKTVIVQIGNSDDKLTQKEWSNFYSEVNYKITIYSRTVHFRGASHGTLPWQNACWVFEIPEGNIQSLKDALTEIRKEKMQDSIAWTEGETLFI